MPNVALEAMSIGVPCMVSPETNMSEIILNSDSGWLVETNEKDIEFFFNNLIKIKKEELVKKGNNAKNFLKDNLTWDKIAKMDYLEK
jgi:glycosyltransferase involved in cell wall biosynthesis